MPSIPDRKHCHKQVCLLGCPGVGKTTQGQLVAALVPGTRFIDMSQVLGIAGAFDPEIHLVAEGYRAKGELVPTTETMNALERFLGSVRKGEQCVFCGVPRDEEQALILVNELWRHVSDYPLKTLRFVLPDRAAAVKRIVERAASLSRKGLPVRTDDLDPVIVEKRIRSHEEREERIMRVLAEHGTILDIESATIEETHSAVLTALEFEPISRLVPVG